MDGEIVFDIHLKTALKRNRKVIALILKNILNNDSVELKTNFALAFKSTVTGIDNREFKIYDATVTKTPLKMASSSLSIFSIVMSICLTFES